MSDRFDGFVAFLAGFFIGGLIGAATALLLAPQSGEETRTLIKDKSIELKDKATETYEDYYARTGEFAESTKTYLDEQKTRLSGTATEAPSDEGVLPETPGDALDEAAAEA